jgi:peptide/nickel transport system ATP-binding protein
MSGHLLEARKIHKVFGVGKNAVRAVHDVDFHIDSGEIVSIVGESGSGKTTLAKLLLGLTTPTAGTIYYKGKPRIMRRAAQRHAYWRNIQAIFQDPFSTFNQFFRIDSILRDCFRIGDMRSVSKSDHEALMREACEFVNLKYDELHNKYPFELSGGQMQRLMIARVFLLKPSVLIADEPTSMIDACSRSTILDMLLKLRIDRGMTILFITHDLGLAYYVSDRIVIMERGSIVE